MKVKTIQKKLFQACIDDDKAAEKKMWLKAIQKSLNGKKTQAIR